MKLLIGLAVLAPLPALADTAPEELFLGDHAWLQDRAELQLTARPAWQRERWEVGAAAEYGVAPRVELAVEGAWHDGPHMAALRELELGARVAALRGARWAVAVGASATAEITDGERELGIEPVASASFATRTVGVNLAASLAVADDIEPSIAVALFARLGAVLPVVEAGVADGAFVARGGLAVPLGSAELAAALGYHADDGVSLEAVVSWEIDLGGGGTGSAGDDDDETAR